MQSVTIKHVFYITTIFYFNFALEISLKNTENNIIQCINKLYSQYSFSYTLLASGLPRNSSYFDVIKNNNGLLISTKNITDSINRFGELKYQMFILLVETVDQFENILNYISKTSIWNSRGKFLVGYFGREEFGDIFNISWSYYIMNINIIAKNYIYTYYPYNDTFCGKYNGYEMLSSCNANVFENIFPVKLPLDLNGCQIKAMAYVIQPYVIDLSMPKEQPGKAGVEITIIHNIAKKMNFSLKFVPNPHKHWGFRFSDGSFSMMYKALKERETDIIFGFTYGNSSYSKDFDASFCHLSDSSVWFFPTAAEMAQWKNLTNIFEPNLWLAILMMILVNGFFCWVIGHTREQSDAYNDITLCIMNSMYILLQGSVENPKTWKVRLIFILWHLTCLLIFTAHQCQLISILTSTLYEQQMSTLDELVASGNEFGFYPAIEEAYREPGVTNQAILHNYEACPLTAECLNRTAFSRDYAVVKNRRQVLYLMPRYYTFPNGRPMLFDTDIPAFTTRERYYVYKGFPMLERFDDILMLLASNGLINKWDMDTRHFVFHQESDSDQEPLSLGHLQGAFLVLCFGVLLSFVSFLFECLLGKCCQISNKSK